MNRNFTFFVSIFFGVLSLTGLLYMYHHKPPGGAPPYDEAFNVLPELSDYGFLTNWKRPDSPPRVGLQVGHWKNSELPEELAQLRTNTGSSGGGKSEWEVNLAIARETEKLLTARGVAVDILPATVPPEYWADAFIAIHADGSESGASSGFKAARPYRDPSGHAHTLLDTLYKTYGEATGLPEDPNITRNMRGYYAFAWWRREHAVHPMTPSVILETGFLTSESDRRIIVDNPPLPAGAIANAVISFLQETGVMTGS